MSHLSDKTVTTISLVDVSVGVQIDSDGDSDDASLKS